ncbi:hypothetical protein DICSQDRAFT_174454 [Dichomitus squalens LYAD-421 SS1]|uniref:Uncharacterized protein n=1 Tax=Dichomitus squalens (strain LYAD-421) TaxID=732165 RepID=R7SPF8_DICSQ|nr:uncharacterized protein DICSQDRAFT_174454 [Dichomitus squalens LYAD-421 SS1]EJF56862.1 hypothetical protein DICSQDRAFT_174454 [Dichomitus squalens LYAD-421 SS1]
MAMEDFFLDHISLQYEGYYNAAHTSTNSSAASIPTDHYLAAWYATGMPSLATPPDGYSYFSQNADYALHGYSSQSEPEAGYPYTCPRSGPTNDSDGADHNVAPSCLEEQENLLYESHQGYPSSDLALLTTSGIDASFSAVTECCDFSQDDPYPYPYAFPTLPSSLQQLSDDPPYMSLPPHHTAAINRWKCPHCSYVQGRRPSSIVVFGLVPPGPSPPLASYSIDGSLPTAVNLGSTTECIPNQQLFSSKPLSGLGPHNLTIFVNQTSSEQPYILDYLWLCGANSNSTASDHSGSDQSEASHDKSSTDSIIIGTVLGGVILLGIAFGV